MDFIINYILGFFVLISVLVFVHELGHYLFAKLFKVKVDAFSIGFGKELFGFTDKSGTRWKFAPIPFGGYVKMKGEMLSNPNTPVDDDSFVAKKVWQKFLIIFAGPLFNLIFPIIIIFGIVFFNGTKNYDTTISKVVKDTPAYNILQDNDKIAKINNTSVTTFKQVQTILQNNPNKTVAIEVLRNNKTLAFNIKLSSAIVNGKQIGVLGVQSALNVISTNYSLTNAIKTSYNTYITVTFAIVNGLKKLFTLQLQLKDIGGPIKIAQIAGESAKQGLSNWLFVMSLISINLAIVNLLPIPALDGGYLLIYLVQIITRKQLSYSLQTKLITFGFMLLILLMVAIVFKDVFGLITGTL